MARRQAAATSWARMFRASGGDCTRDTTVGRRHVAATPRTPRTSGSGGDRTHIDLFKRQVPSQCRPHFHFFRTRNLERGVRIGKPESSKTEANRFFFVASSAFPVPSSKERVRGGIEPRRQSPSVLETEHAPRREALPVWFFTFHRSAFRVPNSKFEVPRGGDDPPPTA